MRAIRFEAFGDPSVLKLVDMPAPALDERTALVRVMAASINPSDVTVLESDGSHQLTLVTCFPFEFIGSAPRRFIVHAVSQY